MLSKIFADLKRRAQGLTNEVSHCVNAAYLIIKANLWEERERNPSQRIVRSTR